MVKNLVKKSILIIAILMVMGTLYTLPVQAATTYSISGTITLSGVGLKGINVAIPTLGLSAVTNGAGNYNITGVPLGKSGTITPLPKSWIFTPKAISFTNIQASLTGKNFTAVYNTAIKYTISGKVTKGSVGLPGVKITLLTFTATTDSTGAYKLANVPVGTKGRIFPSLAGYAFTPTSIAVAPVLGPLVNQNFAATAVFTIGGKVTDAGTGLPLAGVAIKLGTFSATTSSTGTYTLRNIPAGTSGTLIPSLTGKTFTPPSITITNLQAALHSQNFVAAP